ncbi:S8 family serine peptidase, partial [Elusimicrobiota bacterium]
AASDQFKDDISHGTKVFSLIAGKLNKINVVPIKVTDYAKLARAQHIIDGSDKKAKEEYRATDDLIIATAFRLVAYLAPIYREHGYHCIVNASLVSAESDLTSEEKAAWKSALTRLAQLKIPLVTGLGQSKSGGEFASAYPSAFDLKNIITVVSHGEDGDLSSFSNYSREVDFMVPGENQKVTFSKDFIHYDNLPENVREHPKATGNSIAVANGTAIIAYLLEKDYSYQSIMETIKSRGYMGLTAEELSENYQIGTCEIFTNALK